MTDHLRRVAAWKAGALVATLVLAAESAAQDVEFRDNKLFIQFDEIDGTPLADFIALCEKLTDKQLTYTGQDAKDVTLRFIGRKELDPEQFWPYFQAVLKAHDFLVVPYGNIGAPNRPQEGPDTGFFAIRRASTGAAGAKPGYVRTQAPVVSVEQLEAFKYDPGIVLTTSFTLKYVNVQDAMNMLQTYFMDPMLESVRAVGNSNALVVTGFAQTLYGIKQLITLIDTKPDELTPQFAKVELEFAVAEEIQPIVKELIDAERGLGPSGQRVQQGGAAALPPGMQEIEPQVSADPRTNSLLVIAAATTMERILNFIRALDIDVDPRGDSHVYRLKNSAAKDLEEILNEWAQNAGTSTTGGGTAPGGQAGTTQGTLEQPITVVADEFSNSLIISASKSRYAQILEIVKKLDMRRRQVLIETALVEISGTTNERLGVELGYVSVDETPSSGTNRGFGVSSFGLSDLIDTDADNIVDTRVPLGWGEEGSPLPGIQTGIFSGEDFALPLLLHALKATSDVNVLSMPSVLVNDNEEAVISSTDERPTFNVSQGVNSDQTSFNDYEEAGITLNISPSISAGNYLRMLVKLEVSSFLPGDTEPPPKATRMMETSVTLPDGHTMVIGGIVADDQRDSDDMIPWLGELPLFGWLFKSSTSQSNATNLYVFITPHIISDDFATLDDLSYLKKKEMEALNGKIQIVDSDWDRDNADTRVLDAGVSGVFDLPAYASPPGGEVPEPAAPAEVEKNEIPSQYGELPPAGAEDGN